MTWLPKAKRDAPWNLSITSKGSLVLSPNLVASWGAETHVALTPEFEGAQRDLILSPTSPDAPEALRVKTLPGGEGIVDIREFLEEQGIEVAGQPPSVVRYVAESDGAGWRVNLRNPVEGSLTRV